MHRSTILCGAVVATGLACGFWLLAESDSQGVEHGGSEAVNVTRIAPRVGAGDSVEASLYEPVEFVYRIENTGHTPLRGLKPRLGCSCQVTQSPATMLGPGDSTRVGFVVKAFSFGTTEATVALTADGAADPVAVLNPSVHVPIAPPVLHERPESALLSFTQGGPARRVLRFKTIERVDTPPSIQRATTSFDEMLELELKTSVESPYPDPVLCFRAYELGIERRDLPKGTHRGFLMLHMGADALSEPASIPLEVRVVDRLVLLPNPLPIEFSREAERTKARVTVVDRIGDGLIEAVDFDRQLFSVRRLSGGSNRHVQFEIELLPQPAQSLESRVAFTVDEEHRSELVVRIEPEPTD